MSIRKLRFSNLKHVESAKKKKKNHKLRYKPRLYNSLPSKRSNANFQLHLVADKPKEKQKKPIYITTLQMSLVLLKSFQNKGITKTKESKLQKASSFLFLFFFIYLSCVFPRLLRNQTDIRNKTCARNLMEGQIIVEFVPQRREGQLSFIASALCLYMPPLLFILKAFFLCVCLSGSVCIYA